MSAYPLLTKVLAEAWAEPFAVESFDPGLAAELIAGMPPDIADRLERALDVCAVCGAPSAVREFHDREAEVFRSHPYQPLVAP